MGESLCSLNVHVSSAMNARTGAGTATGRRPAKRETSPRAPGAPPRGHDQAAAGRLGGRPHRRHAPAGSPQCVSGCPAGTPRPRRSSRTSSSRAAHSSTGSWRGRSPRSNEERRSWTSPATRWRRRPAAPRSPSSWQNPAGSPLDAFGAPRSCSWFSRRTPATRCGTRSAVGSTARRRTPSQCGPSTACAWRSLARPRPGLRRWRSRPRTTGHCLTCSSESSPATPYTLDGPICCAFHPNHFLFNPLSPSALATCYTPTSSLPLAGTIERRTVYFARCGAPDSAQGLHISRLRRSARRRWATTGSTSTQMARHCSVNGCHWCLMHTPVTARSRIGATCDIIRMSSGPVPLHPSETPPPLLTGNRRSRTTPSSANTVLPLVAQHYTHFVQPMYCTLSISFGGP